MRGKEQEPVLSHKLSPSWAWWFWPSHCRLTVSYPKRILKRQIAGIRAGASFGVSRNEPCVATQRRVLIGSIVVAKVASKWLASCSKTTSDPSGAHYSALQDQQRLEVRYL